MGKRDDLKELTNLLSKAIVHKIGSIVNSNAIYSGKYQKEFKNFIEQAERVKLRENWNSYDKEAIKKETREKTFDELNKREFLDKKKFEIMDENIEELLKEMELN